MASVRKCPGCFVSRNMFHMKTCDLVMVLGRENVMKSENGEPAWFGSVKEAQSYRDKAFPISTLTKDK